MIRLNSIPGTSSSQDRTEDGEEDAWTIWGRVVSDWDNFFKKKNQYVRVRLYLCIPLKIFSAMEHFDKTSNFYVTRILSERVSQTNCGALFGNGCAVHRSRLLPNNMLNISRQHRLVKRFAVRILSLSKVVINCCNCLLTINFLLESTIR